MVEEARLEQLDAGLTPVTDGWFVVGIAEAAWVTREGGPAACVIEGDDVQFPDVGFTVAVLQPGEPNGMYHREGNQEDFLVLAGECLLLIEGQERRLKTWDFVHCPPDTEHIFVGAGDGPCAIFMTGGRKASRGCPGRSGRPRVSRGAAAAGSPYPGAGMRTGTTAAQSGTASFEFERLEWTAPDRVEVAGRWFGVRGLRFMRPSLDVQAGDDRRHLLALLDHKPWAAEDGEEWIAAFPWQGDQVELTQAELAVTPGVVVDLPLPGTSGKRAKGAKKSKQPKTRSRNGAKTPARGRKVAAAEPVAPARREAAEAPERRALDEILELRRERDAAVAARDEARRERDEALAVRDTSVGERDDVARARDEAIADRDRAIADRDQTATARDEARRERDQAIAGRDQAMSELRTAVSDRDAAFAERDAARRAHSDLVAARDTAATALEYARTAAQAAKAERDAARLERDAARQERDEARRAHDGLRTQAPPLDGAAAPSPPGTQERSAPPLGAPVLVAGAEAWRKRALALGALALLLLLVVVAVIQLLL